MNRRGRFQSQKIRLETGKIQSPRITNPADFRTSPDFHRTFVIRWIFDQTSVVRALFDMPLTSTLLDGRVAQGLPGDLSRPVLANFNKVDKLNPESFALWMQILRRAPGSVLWLLDPSAVDSEVQAQIMGLSFVHCGTHLNSRSRFRRRRDLGRW